MEKNPKATMKEIEHVLDGNLCRCTGYRPIHDAFKSFASDASESLLKTVTDIEDAGNHEYYLYDSSLISCVPIIFCRRLCRKRKSHMSSNRKILWRKSIRCEAFQL